MIILRQKEFKKDSVIGKVLTKFFVPDPKDLEKREGRFLEERVGRIQKTHERAKKGGIVGVLIPKAKDPNWVGKETERVRKTTAGYINSINK